MSKEIWKDGMLQLWEYPGDPFPSREYTNEVDSLWWNPKTDSFFYCYRDKRFEPYSKENAKDDIRRYYELRQMWGLQIIACRRAGLLD